MELFERVRASKNILYMLAGAVLLLFLFGGVFLSGRSPKPSPSPTRGTISEVTIDNGSTRLTVKRNGVVRVAHGDRVFYQFWEEARVEELFSRLETLDLSSFDSQLKPGEVGYVLTLTTSQGVITIAIPQDALDLPDVIQELIETVDELTEQFDEDEAAGGAAALLSSPSPSPSPLASFTPTPVPAVLPSAVPSPTPTPTSGSGGGLPTQQIFACEFAGATRIRVLSETICDLLE